MARHSGWTGSTLLCALLAFAVTSCGDAPPPEAAAPAWARVSPEQITESKKCGVLVAFENELGMRFVLIPAGSFTMGCRMAARKPPTTGNDFSLTPHEVTLTRPYYLQVTEVSNRHYLAVEATEATDGAPPPLPADPDKPVIQVSYEDARAFCRRLSAFDARPYRLPTEAEWERACRSGRAQTFAYGKTVTPEQANLDFTNEHRRIHEQDGRIDVGSLVPSPWGLHDLHGNVWEICLDSLRGYPMDTVVDPRPSGPAQYRAHRGGAWYDRPCDATAWQRGGVPPEYSSHDTGFRVACDLPESGKLER